MCGIVLAGGNLGASDLEIFNQLLYCDVFRGQHSTGVFAKRLNETEVLTYKEALPSYALLLKNEYKELTTGKTNYTVAPSWIVGHNRHATRGAVNAQNAHPFTHGNITLVHNGTLVNQDLLPEASRFVVDSENICYSIDKIGAEETIQKLDGAFTLVWHDASDETLHIIRNDERPFHLCRIGVDWFGASEEDMLMWILKRSKTHKNRASEHFECKVGVEYIFDVKGGRKMTLIEEKEHKLPVFTVASRWGGYYSQNWQDRYYQDERFERHSSENAKNKNANPYTSPASQAAKRAKDIADQNKLASDRGLDVRRDQIIDFTPCMFEEYASSYGETKGKMTGYIFDDKLSEYFEVDVHNILKKDYELSLQYPKSGYSGTVSCIAVVKDMLRCVVISGKWTGIPELDKEPESTTSSEFDDNDVPFDLNDSFINKQGVTVTRKFWESFSHGDCEGCGNHIEWEEAPKAIFAYQAYWHPACLKKSQLTDESKGDNELAICSLCSKIVPPSEVDTQMSSFRQEDICTTCAGEIRQNAAKIQAVNGGVWTRFIDKTTPRHTEGSIRVTKEMLDKMILMAESVRSDLTLEDLPLCYVEKRIGGNYAVAMLPEGVKSPDEVRKGGLSARPAETFRPSESRNVLSLSKIVRSLDGVREKKVTKAFWNSIGYCEFCYKQIPWKDVEACTLGKYNRIVCPSDTCRGKLNGNQKNPA